MPWWIVCWLRRNCAPWPCTNAQDDREKKKSYKETKDKNKEKRAGGRMTKHKIKRKHTRAFVVLFFFDIYMYNIILHSPSVVSHLFLFSPSLSLFIFCIVYVFLLNFYSLFFFFTGTDQSLDIWRHFSLTNQQLCAIIGAKNMKQWSLW